MLPSAYVLSNHGATRLCAMLGAMSEDRGRGESGTGGSPGSPDPKVDSAPDPAAHDKALEPITGSTAPLPAGPDGTKPTPSTPAKPPKAAKEPTPIRATTRASAAWFATGAALVILVLLIILILQNQTVVEVTYLWFSASIPLGTALLIAAIAGASVVMMIGIVRLTQLRINARRATKAAAATAARKG